MQRNYSHIFTYAMYNIGIHMYIVYFIDSTHSGMFKLSSACFSSVNVSNTTIRMMSVVVNVRTIEAEHRQHIQRITLELVVFTVPFGCLFPRRMMWERDQEAFRTATIPITSERLDLVAPKCAPDGSANVQAWLSAHNTMSMFGLS